LKNELSDFEEFGKKAQFLADCAAVGLAIVRETLPEQDDRRDAGRMLNDLLRVLSVNDKNHAQRAGALKTLADRVAKLDTVPLVAATIELSAAAFYRKAAFGVKKSRETKHKANAADAVGRAQILLDKGDSYEDILHIHRGAVPGFSPRTKDAELLAQREAARSGASPADEPAPAKPSAPFADAVIDLSTVRYWLSQFGHPVGKAERVLEARREDALPHVRALVDQIHVGDTAKALLKKWGEPVEVAAVGSEGQDPYERVLGYVVEASSTLEPEKERLFEEVRAMPNALKYFGRIARRDDDLIVRRTAEEWAQRIRAEESEPVETERNYWDVPIKLSLDAIEEALLFACFADETRGAEIEACTRRLSDLGQEALPILKEAKIRMGRDEGYRRPALLAEDLIMGLEVEKAAENPVVHDRQRAFVEGELRKWTPYSPAGPREPWRGFRGMEKDAIRVLETIHLEGGELKRAALAALNHFGVDIGDVSRGGAAYAKVATIVNTAVFERGPQYDKLFQEVRALPYGAELLERIARQDQDQMTRNLATEWAEHIRAERGWLLPIELTTDAVYSALLFASYADSAFGSEKVDCHRRLSEMGRDALPFLRQAKAKLEQEDGLKQAVEEADYLIGELESRPVSDDDYVSALSAVARAQHKRQVQNEELFEEVRGMPNALELLERIAKEYLHRDVRERAAEWAARIRAEESKPAKPQRISDDLGHGLAVELTPHMVRDLLADVGFRGDEPTGSASETLRAHWSDAYALVRRWRKNPEVGVTAQKLVRIWGEPVRGEEPVAHAVYRLTSEDVRWAVEEFADLRDSVTDRGTELYNLFVDEWGRDVLPLLREISKQGSGVSAKMRHTADFLIADIENPPPDHDPANLPAMPPEDSVPKGMRVSLEVTNPKIDYDMLLRAPTGRVDFELHRDGDLYHHGELVSGNHHFFGPDSPGVGDTAVFTIPRRGSVADWGMMNVLIRGMTRVRGDNKLVDPSVVFGGHQPKYGPEWWKVPEGHARRRLFKAFRSLCQFYNRSDRLYVFGGGALHVFVPEDYTDNGIVYRFDFGDNVMTSAELFAISADGTSASHFVLSAGEALKGQRAVRVE